MNNKTCTKCKVSLPCTEEYFFKRGDQPGKFRSHCRQCHHDNNVKKCFEESCEKYGVTTQEDRRIAALKSVKESVSKANRIYPVGMTQKDHVDQLTEAYISQMLLRRKTHISVELLRKYPNVTEAYRTMIKMKRANGGITQIAKINACLQFNGSIDARRKYLSNIHTRRHCAQLSDYYVAGQLCYYYGISTKDVRNNPELLESTRLTIQIKRELKQLKQVS